MCLWAIVPVKPLRRAKSRLAEVLTCEQREQLNFDMLKRTLKALSEVPEIGKVLVVSSDMSALALARDYNARTLLEDGHTKLNTALTRATTLAQAYATSGTMVIPADLPLINSADIQAFIAMSQHSPEVVIAPDRLNLGTNGLLVSPTGLIQYAFGPSSFQRHSAQAYKVGARVEIYRSTAFALDIDTPYDLAIFRQLEAGIDNLAEINAETTLDMEAK
jgi:2-phospho-L-lactate/phosphoenolpyruvate guanylyltransferase